ncbi:aminotransferase class V-fold PLP-dependent enzyme [Thermoactinomyces intermedius]|jgi:cysteine desulfurase family protein|uniref:cysteine desulfurase n=1 Tax=Thermoactinomyces intermedius TaxID=2024 RepID=A0A8I1AFD6_THEIN|nr:MULTISPECIES: aminotransferase class V-fold PLP-dependent enzyme [Thermoactinomyces]MBA4549975.1 aminotransferase class V-fold PLP-dependent enzyme [Thermoactinomyces intermedius]MBA4835721.1 aminotransferase class V-fold PLP-dependent enzyme [Thermoactinomyces intermedius]MBH8596304.1 aminotransferase class V-fold PLP-dependent enzyme [Thermoactinomyces intermedius]MBH8600446.1 aminotransferase class V-fold PLP-dependent enzyme [Thermoactinomyces sp. CICC 23799]
MIYFDNAASSWPKPPEVAEAVQQAIMHAGANPGRGGHQLARKAEDIIEGTRGRLAELLGVHDPQHLLFCFNTTHAINQALKGLLKEGDHLVITGWEHNAVARPAFWLQDHHGIGVSVVDVDAGGDWVSAIKKEIRPNTRLLVTIHGSNVTGECLPVLEIGEFAREQGIYYLVDAAQTAGLFPYQLDQMPIDMLAFPGHKSLLGPQGTGGLYVAPNVPLTPWMQGGTGTKSEEMDQPQIRPTGFESGTPNTPGIAGLGKGVEFLLKTGVGEVCEHEQALTRQLWEGLREIDGVELVTDAPPALPVISFNIQGVDSNEVAMILDQHYQMAVRAGFHCAALKHRGLKTETGTVRVSPGYFNTKDEVDQLLAAVREISKAYSL